MTERKTRTFQEPDLTDPDNPEWTKEDFARARPAREILGADIAAQLVRKRGRPTMAEGKRKEKVTLRLSPETIGHFRRSGEGWQTRLDAVLLEYVRAAKVKKGDEKGRS
jgi:uncharacterized protein (DUF4415 family)